MSLVRVHYFKVFRDSHPVEIFTEGEDSIYEIYLLSKKLFASSKLLDINAQVSVNLCSFVFFNPFLPVVIAPQCVLVHFKANIAISLKRKPLENKSRHCYS